MAFRFDVITLFPDMFGEVMKYGVVGRAGQRHIYTLTYWNPRSFTEDIHQRVDDKPYGGGPGMVMLAEPLERAIDSARNAQIAQGITCPYVVHLSPTGEKLTHKKIKSIQQYGRFDIACKPL